MSNPKIILITASFLLALAVAAGAFGAHALRSILTPERLDTWETAVQYHAWHALGLMIIALAGAHFQLSMFWPATLILTGIVIFSGSLYVLCLSGINWLGAITPIGGLAFIGGWILFGLELLKTDF